MKTLLRGALYTVLTLYLSIGISILIFEVIR